MWLARRGRRQPERIDVCLRCGGDFVHPVEWHEADATRQRVLLRCGQCDTWREGTFTDAELDRFDRLLDEHTRQMTHAAARLSEDWQSKEADLFAAALERDLIDAGDFAR